MHYAYMALASKPGYECPRSKKVIEKREGREGGNYMMKMYVTVVLEKLEVLCTNLKEVACLLV